MISSLEFTALEKKRIIKKTPVEYLFSFSFVDIVSLNGSITTRQDMNIVDSR